MATQGLVVLCGLKKQETLNGSVVVLLGSELNGRLQAETEGGRQISLPIHAKRDLRNEWNSQLRRVPSRVEAVPGCLCVVDRLQDPEKGARWNGAVVITKGTNPANSRVLVETECGHVMALKDTNLRPVSPSWQEALNESEASSDDDSVGDDVFRVLLLGATGAGKTAFLNLLANMNKVNELGDSDISAFTGINDMALENPAQKMQSQTSKASKYLIRIGDMRIQVVDTPGLADTGGLDKDKEHIESIITTIRKCKRIHCICLIANGRSPRLTFDLQYAIQQLMTIMPACIVKNIRVVFTNVSDPLEMTFDLTTLREILNVAKVDPICIENPWCKLEKARSPTCEIPLEMIQASLQKSFAETKTCVNRLLDDLGSKMHPVFTSEFEKLHAAKLAIENACFRLCHQVEQISKCEENCNLLQANLLKARDDEAYWQNFRARSRIQAKQSLALMTSAYNNVICKHPDCQSVPPKGNCHLNCDCFKPPFIVRNPLDIKHRCAKFAKHQYFVRYAGIGVASTEQVNDCQHCGHDFQWHTIGNLVWQIQEEKNPVVDDIANNCSNYAQRAQACQQLVSENEEKLQSLRNQRQGLAKELILKVVDFQAQALSRNYRKVLVSQVDLLKDHIKKLQDHVGGYIMADQLHETIAHIQGVLKHFDAAHKEIFENAASRKDWACAILGVAKDADSTEVKKAYKTKALQFHPDKDAGEERMFKNLQRARDILLNV